MILLQDEVPEMVDHNTQEPSLRDLVDAHNASHKYKTGSESESSDEEGSDKITKNRDYRPYRDEDTRQHINRHMKKSSKKSVCSISIASSVAMDPDLVKRKVASQLKLREKRKQARRIRKSGESAISTGNRRDNQYTIKTSLSAEWY